jgi:hypothetical protein
MNALEIIDEHMIIRNTIGYDGIKDIEVYDLPDVLVFFKIVYNYMRMKSILDESKKN